MRKTTIGVLVGLLSVGCGDPSDEPRDDGPESEQAERGSGLYSVTFAVKANPESLGSASVSIFNALGETCAGTSCRAYPLNQAYFQATPKSSARFVGWSGCSFVGLGHYSAATFLENVGVLDETCTANFADASGTTPDTREPSDFPTFPDPDFPDESDTHEPEEGSDEDVFPGQSTPDMTSPEDTFPGDDEQEAEPSEDEEPVGGTGSDEDKQTTPGKTTPDETTPDETTPGKTTPGKTTPGKTTPGKTTPGKTTPDETTPGKTTPGKTTPDETPPEPTPPVAEDEQTTDDAEEEDGSEPEPLFPPASEDDEVERPSLGQPWSTSAP